jgi:ribosomal protein S18 acetylase RimI-like enzyme
MDSEFLWRAEMAFRAAWPAEHESEVGGWVARRSGGSIRRVNSFNQMPGCQTFDDTLLDRTEAHYARFDQPAIVRLMSFADAASEPTLARRGYEINGRTTALRAPLPRSRQEPEEGIIVSGRPEAIWLDARSRVSDRDPVLFRSMLDLIKEPTLFAGACIDGAIQSVGYGVIVDGLLVIESVATDTTHQGRGLARQVVGTLMHWAASKGIKDVVLQVETDNTPARALYRSLGFETELFNYFYMRQPQS